jgi:hypothetical protein
MPFIMCPEKNGSNPLAIAGSGLIGDPVLRPKQPDPGRSQTEQPDPGRLDGIRPFPGQNGRDLRDLAVSREERPDPTRLDGKGLNGRDGWDPAILRTKRPDPAWLDGIWPGSGPSPTRSMVGVVVQSETVWISGGSGSELCGRRGLFPTVWWFPWKWVVSGGVMVSMEVGWTGEERVFLSMHKKTVLTFFNVKLTWSLSWGSMSVCKVIFVRVFVPLAFL